MRLCFQMENPETAVVARLNDQLRREFLGGAVLITPQVEALSADIRARVLAAVRNFDQFTPDNDPYGERDFGKVSVDGEAYFFKIDYYDKRYEGHSPNKADPDVTRRVMTIMHALEY